MCIWESPTTSIGFEIIFDFQTTSNFDLKFLIATPFEFFSRLLLRGKLKPQVVRNMFFFRNILLKTLAQLNGF